MRDKPKRCLITFATKGREDYVAAIERWMKSTEDCSIQHKIICTPGDKRYWFACQNYPDTKKYGPCPKHEDVPYAFKPYLFQKAFEEGYEQVIWMDSTIVLAGDPTPWLSIAEERGLALGDNLGHPLYKYLSDDAANILGTTNLELMHGAVMKRQLVPQITACVIGIDIRHPTAKKVFHKWITLARDGIAFRDAGSRRPGFVAHRHDQAVLSYLAWNEGIDFVPFGTIAYHNNYTEYPQNIFINKPVKML